MLTVPRYGRVAIQQLLVEILDRPADAVSSDTFLLRCRPKGDEAIAQIDIVALGHHKIGHGHAGHRFALAPRPVLDGRLSHLGWRIVLERHCHQVAHRLRQVQLCQVHSLSRPVSLNISQSLFDSQQGGTAADKGWMKECMSVLFRSSFSYQVAVGRTISEYSAVGVHAEVEIHHQVKLAFVGRPHAQVTSPSVSPATSSAMVWVMGAQVVLEEIFLPLGAGVERIAAPDEP